MQVEEVPVESLIPYTNNNVRHSDAQVDRIANSIRRFGWTVPLLVSKDNVLIAGHGRLLAAKKLGLAAVPVVRREDLTPALEREYRLIDNALSKQSDWDFEALAAEFPLLQEDGFDFKEWGVDALFPAVADKILDGGEPASPPAAPNDTPQFLVVVECENEAKQQELYDEFEGRGFKCRLIT
jgi:hypothetical protein